MVNVSWIWWLLTDFVFFPLLKVRLSGSLHDSGTPELLVAFIADGHYLQICPMVLPKKKTLQYHKEGRLAG